MYFYDMSCLQKSEWLSSLTKCQLVMIESEPPNEYVTKESWHFICPFQIRAEKPYYVADPEVDSLVRPFYFTYWSLTDFVE